VFCDLNLPEVDGLGIAAILRQRSPMTPIVIVSAAWDVPEVRAALEGHLIDRVLAKPWRSEELKSLLAAPLEQPKVG